MTRQCGAGLALVLSIVSTACDNGQRDTCVLGDSTSCGEGRVCEEVEGGQPACFAPIFVEGRVLDIIDEAGIGGARVVAIDARMVHHNPMSSCRTTMEDTAFRCRLGGMHRVLRP